jgi:hypothetical protein
MMLSSVFAPDVDITELDEHLPELKQHIVEHF